MAHEVFISYSITDQKTAMSICRALEEKGIQCWIAPRDVPPGKEWPEVIVDAIDSSKVMILILTSSSNHSPQVSRELNRAASKGIPLISFRVEEVHPSKTIEYFIGNHQWIDALSSPIENHIQRLAESVQLLLQKDHLSGPRKPDTKTADNLKSFKLKSRKWIRTGLVWVLTVTMVGILTVYFTHMIREKTQSTSSIIPETGSEFQPIPPSKSISELVIASEFETELEHLNGIAWDGRHIWIVTNSGNLFQMNAEGKILTSCMTPEFTPEGLTWDGNSFWIFTTNFSYIYRFAMDAAEVKPKPKVLGFFKSPNETIGGHHDGLAWDGSHLWYADQHNIYQLDADGKIIKHFAFEFQVADLAYDGETLWLIAYKPGVVPFYQKKSTLHRINTAGKIIQTYSLPVPIEGLAWGNGCFWAMQSGQFDTPSKVYRIEPKIEENIDLLSAYSRSGVTSVDSKGFGAPYGSWGLVWDGKHLWSASITTGLLFKMNQKGDTLNTWPMPITRPKALTWDGKAFWVFDAEKESILQFKLSGSMKHRKTEVIKSFPAPKSEDIGGSFGSLAWDGRYLWYADRFNIYRLDINGTIIKKMKAIQQIFALAWDGTSLWMASPHGNFDYILANVDTEGNVLSSFNCGLNQIRDLAWGDQQMWSVSMSQNNAPNPQWYEIAVISQIVWEKKIIQGN
jgi:hypothetical protein